MRHPESKPRLSLLRILEMNLGFLGLQFSFGLQQGNMGPIYSYLGASEATLPLLLLAGPATGLIVQPLIGAMSDRTDSRFGRRTPYFVVGAVLCMLGLFLMPLSRSIVMAASLLWMLDAGNNITMEPYRAYVSDRLHASQHELGFLTQSAFTGLAQMLAFLTPSLLVWAGMSADWVDAHNIPYTTRIVFMVGAVLSISTILWSILRVPELPLTGAEKAAIAGQSKTVRATLAEIRAAIRDMPAPMRRLGLMSLFQWYGMWAYWSYNVYAIARAVYGSSVVTSSSFHAAVLTNGEMAAFYNGVAFVAAFAMVPLARRTGAGVLHAICLVFAGIGMLWLAQVHDKTMLFVPAIGIGIGWASMMGNPYVILAGAIPPARTGVYMGIFNMMIVLPMMLFGITMPFLYDLLLGGDPRHVLMLAGVLMLLAAAAVLTVREGRTAGRRPAADPSRFWDPALDAHPFADPAPTAWAAWQVAGADWQPAAVLPVIGAGDVVPLLADRVVWDMWPIQRADGATVTVAGRTFWFFLAAPREADPDARHDQARIRLFSHGADGWRDHGDTFPDGFTPGSREWSGTAVLADDGVTLTHYFTAAGRRGGARSFEQRLFETQGRFAWDGAEPVLDRWTAPIESVAAEGPWYAPADQAAPVDGLIRGFRDPGFFRDPADGADYLLFAGTAADSAQLYDGVVGLARREAAGWELLPPLVTAIGVNAELERPHIVVVDELYYLFWSTQRARFAPGGPSGPNGLYGMVADQLAGPWQPLNGTGLVAANPAEEPRQAYCWWVTGELDVISFVDLWGVAGRDPTDPAIRATQFGGTVAPWFRLEIDGARVVPC